MPTISVNVPEKMRKKIDELAEENMYSNTSEYIRAALRRQINQDTGLTPEEEEIVLERMEKADRGETDWVSLEEVKEGLNE
jgi:Arc/MetJ-type ribon-helix-helix transcriptional regulator